MVTIFIMSRKCTVSEINRSRCSKSHGHLWPGQTGILDVVIEIQSIKRRASVSGVQLE